MVDEAVEHDRGHCLAEDLSPAPEGFAATPGRARRRSSGPDRQSSSSQSSRPYRATDATDTRDTASLPIAAHPETAGGTCTTPAGTFSAASSTSAPMDRASPTANGQPLCPVAVPCPNRRETVRKPLDTWGRRPACTDSAHGRATPPARLLTRAAATAPGWGHGEGRGHVSTRQRCAAALPSRRPGQSRPGRPHRRRPRRAIAAPSAGQRRLHLRPRGLDTAPGRGRKVAARQRIHRPRHSSGRRPPARQLG